MDTFDVFTPHYPIFIRFSLKRIFFPSLWMLMMLKLSKSEALIPFSSNRDHFDSMDVFLLIVFYVFHRNSHKEFGWVASDINVIKLIHTWTSANGKTSCLLIRKLTAQITPMPYTRDPFNRPPNKKYIWTNNRTTQSGEKKKIEPTTTFFSIM